MAGVPLRTRLCEILGIEHPVIAFTHCREVAVAAIRAGGFAVLGEAMKTADEIQENVRWLRSQVGDKPFGIDLVLPSNAPQQGTPEELIAQIPEPHVRYKERIHAAYDVPLPHNPVALRQWGGLNKRLALAQIDCVLDERVPAIATGLGSPEFLFEAAHERGIQMIGLIGATRQARRVLEMGADMVVAQGYDAAGHTGAMGTFSIVPEVVDIAGDKPVIAAGGVTTGSHLAAALCLGASGVWTGTVWLAAEESDVDPLVKQRILQATGDDTTRTACISGKTMRVLKCPWTEEWGKEEAPAALASPFQMLLSSDYLQAANDSRRADLMTEAVGQGVAFVDGPKPVGEILHGMVDEAGAILGRFG
ncbi:MAG: monooxygenase [Deltaproteobacteria bacterium]|jgi:NAD(P)H-dependent flavin oxidoreductase YrpB (nitropropane dioxygenase family)|nr:monooxygenase [Deltaproteobacteria bacterium]